VGFFRRVLCLCLAAVVDFLIHLHSMEVLFCSKGLSALVLSRHVHVEMIWILCHVMYKARSPTSCVKILECMTCTYIVHSWNC
jgi:hypothetical protein